MSEGIETRSKRSRSKTPGLMLIENENIDTEKKGTKKKIPTVSLIEEEDDVVEAPLTQPSLKQRRQRRGKIASSESSSLVAEVSESEKSSKNLQSLITDVKESAVSSSTKIKSITIVTSAVQQISEVEESVEQASSTIETPQMTKSNEVQDVPENLSIFNTVFNAIKTSTPILSNKRTKRAPQEVTSMGIDVNQHPAYKEYKEAGEYWNRYPKTDYTYSELSPHRRDLGAGIVAMPNMSRRSLDKYQIRVETMIQNNPAEENKMRRKFLTSNAFFQKRSAELQYDSADEVDISELRHKLGKRSKPSSNMFSRLLLPIIGFLSSRYFSIKRNIRGIFYYQTSEHYAYTPPKNAHKEDGLMRRIFERITKFILLGISKAYLFMSSHLCLDTWMLYSRSENAELNCKRRKRFLLGLLISLPLLILGAAILSDSNTEAATPLSFHYIKKFTSARLTTFKWYSLDWIWTSVFSFGGALVEPVLHVMRFRTPSTKFTDNDNFQLLKQHVDDYIDLAVGQKINDNLITQNINDRLRLIASETIFDALENYHYELTSNDMEEIGRRINEKIDAEFSANERNFMKTMEKDKIFEGVEEVIQKTLQSRTPKLDKQNMDDIISGIRASTDRINQHDTDMETIKLDIFKLKLQIRQHAAAMSDDVNKLRNQQKNYLHRMRFETDEKIVQIISKLDSQLVAIKSHYASMDKNNIFQAKPYLDEHLRLAEASIADTFRHELDKNAGILMDAINEEIKKQLTGQQPCSNGLTEDDVARIVNRILIIYDADKIGLVDFALESAGGQVLSTRCTENYQSRSAELSIFGIPIWYPANTPRTVISPSVQPGECWAFQGFPGYLVIQLNSAIHVTGFTIEHLPQTLAPNGNIDSAPNNFTVWGLLTETDKDPVKFGSYYYSAMNDAPGLQKFSVQNHGIHDPYQIIELRIESNHGNPKFTCLYRFRVHGNIKP